MIYELRCELLVSAARRSMAINKSASIIQNLQLCCMCVCVDDWVYCPIVNYDMCHCVIFKPAAAV